MDTIRFYESSGVSVFNSNPLPRQKINYQSQEAPAVLPSNPPLPKKRRKFSCIDYFLFLLLFIVLGSVGFFFFSDYWVGEIEYISLPQSYFSQIEGEVLLIRNQEEVKAKKDMKVEQNDTIKTGFDSRATVVFYDSSATQIDPNTEVLIKNLHVDKENFTNKKVGIKVQVGRIWSRILQLADKEAEFKVESSKTVATVRGTAFDFTVAPEGLVQIDSIESELELTVYETSDKEKVIQSQFLAEENSAHINEEDTENLSTEGIFTTTLPQGKIKEKLAIDKKIKDFIISKNQEQVKETAGILPDSKLYKFKRAKEKKFLQQTKDPREKRKLVVILITRRLAEAQRLQELGKENLANELLRELQSNLEKISSQVPQRELPYFKELIRNQLAIQQVSLIETPHEEFKEKIEDLELSHAVKKEDIYFIRLKNLEKKLPQNCQELEEFKGNLEEFRNDEDQAIQTRLRYLDFKLENLSKKFCKEKEPQKKKELFNDFKESFKESLEQVKDSLKGTQGKVANAAERAKDATGETFKEATTDLTENIKEEREETTEAIDEIGDKASETAKDVKGVLVTIAVISVVLVLLFLLIKKR